MADDVSYKLSSHLASLMSAIHEEHEAEDGDGITFHGKDLFSTLKITLGIVDSVVHEKGDSYIKDLPETWSQFIPVLGKLVSASESNKHLQQQFEALLTNNSDALCTLLTCFGTKKEQWISKLKGYTNFEVRHRFSMFMFPPLSGPELDIDVDRSNLLEESFTQVMKKNPVNFLGGVSPFFKGEEASGEGVLRQWLCLVSEELFDPKRKLFVVTQDDNRRIAPDPLSAKLANHLDYFRFAGRIIGLSLKHNIQIGLLFDPIFFKVLSGTAVVWEDLRETDYETYAAFKAYLEIDPEEFDKGHGSGLFFTVDVTDMSGELRSHPLVVNGEDVAVTSANRESFFQLTVQHKYVTIVRDQTLSFSQGFEDMLSEGTSSSKFFSSIHLQDVDSMLHGSEQENLCPYEWRAHTSLVGCDSNDDVIKWFWQTVEEMTNEQRRRLLFFWTAVNYLPRNGFERLPDPPTIQLTDKDVKHRLPKASTCSCRLTLPRYPTYDLTKSKVHYILHEDVSTSFGRL